MKNLETWKLGNLQTWKLGNFVLIALLWTAVPGFAQDSTKTNVQPGFGTLKQDEFTLGIRSGNLLIKVTPLNESVIRLAAPDTYNRLHALADSRRAQAVQRSGGEHPELFMVSFFSYQPNTTYQPEDLQLDYNGKFLRPAAILPITPKWGNNQLGQQEMQAAIYVFKDSIDFQLPLVVKFGMDENGNWQKIIPVLQVERTKILSRQVKKD